MVKLDKMAARRERLERLLKDFRSEKLKTPEILSLLVEALVQITERETDLTIPYLEQTISQLQAHQEEIQTIHSAQTRLF
jgi:hypothetical protein